MRKKLLKKLEKPELLSKSKTEDKKFYYGYIRVSSVQQSDNGSLSSQREILSNFGITEQNIYSDVKSGKNVEDRIQLNNLLKIRMNSASNKSCG